MSTRAGVCQAVFPEGGLTKNGCLREPKLGFMDYMLREFHPKVDKDVVFVPIGINYDRVIEDRSLIRKIERGAAKRSTWFVFKTALGFIYKMSLLSRKMRWRRFGYASVNFGPPVSAKAYCEENDIDFSQLEQKPRFEKVKALAESLMSNIADVVPVLPVALISQVLLNNKACWKSELELKSLAIESINRLKQQGAPITLSASACEGVLTNAVNLLLGRGLIEIKDNLMRADTSAEVLLAYYANSIDRWQDAK